LKGEAKEGTSLRALLKMEREIEEQRRKGRERTFQIEAAIVKVPQSIVAR